MEYFDANSSSLVFTKAGYGESVLTPFGTKLIGYIVLFMWFGTVLSKKSIRKERQQLDDIEYEYLNIRKKEKEEQRKIEKKKRQKKRKKQKMRKS